MASSLVAEGCLINSVINFQILKRPLSQRRLFQNLHKPLNLVRLLHPFCIKWYFITIKDLISTRSSIVLNSIIFNNCPAFHLPPLSQTYGEQQTLYGDPLFIKKLSPQLAPWPSVKNCFPDFYWQTLTMQ